MRRFVVVVDTQADFMNRDGALPVPGADALAEPMRRWLASLDPAETAGVLFTFDTHHADTYPRSAEAAMFPIHCVRGTPGWANVLDPALVHPVIPRYRLEKGVFDMWAEPGLAVEEPATGCLTDRDAFFDALALAGVSEVAVIGVAADYCVRWAVEGLLARGFRVVLPAGLTRGIEREAEAVAAEEFAGRALELEPAP